MKRLLFCRFFLFRTNQYLMVSVLFIILYWIHRFYLNPCTSMSVISCCFYMAKGSILLVICQCTWFILHLVSCIPSFFFFCFMWWSSSLWYLKFILGIVIDIIILKKRCSSNNVAYRIKVIRYIIKYIYYVSFWDLIPLCLIS